MTCSQPDQFHLKETLVGLFAFFHFGTEQGGGGSKKITLYNLMYWRFARHQFCIFDELQMSSSDKNRPIKSISVFHFFSSKRQQGISLTETFWNPPYLPKAWNQPKKETLFNLIKKKFWCRQQTWSLTRLASDKCALFKLNLFFIFKSEKITHTCSSSSRNRKMAKGKT